MAILLGLRRLESQRLKDDLIGMRDASRPDGPVLVFTEAEWDAFVAGAKDGEFDLPEDDVPA